MPRITIDVGTRERLEPAISKATPLGALGTEALVWIGATSIRGRATALRALADALVEAAEMAEAYDADPRGLRRARAGPALHRRLTASLRRPAGPSPGPPQPTLGGPSMLRTPPHPGDQADRTERRLARVRVALVAALTTPHAASLASQICWQRPGLSTGPTSSREATP
jgi:hypothetical protein